MRIVYIARHNQQCSNDDEGAITHALRELGHRVVEVKDVPNNTFPIPAGTDLILGHNIADPSILERSKGVCPRALWYFDLVQQNDLKMVERNAKRIRWYESVVNHCDLFFMTDGDWVRRAALSHVRVLRQGADERMMTVPESLEKDRATILFTGTIRGGVAREKFVAFMNQAYSGRFKHIGLRCHGEELKREIAEAAVTMAPPGPITPSYWSNRLYLSCGFGAFLLHPECKGAEYEYPSDAVTFYKHPLRAMNERLKWALGLTRQERFETRIKAYERTLNFHTYRHRVESLIQQVKELGHG